MSTINYAANILRDWGVSENTVNTLVASQLDLDQAKHIIAIEECLQLLYPDLNAKRQFLKTASKSVFFHGRKPLDVITSGQLSEVEEAHQIIRSMLCI